MCLLHTLSSQDFSNERHLSASKYRTCFKAELHKILVFLLHAFMLVFAIHNPTRGKFLIVAACVPFLCLLSTKKQVGDNVQNYRDRRQHRCNIWAKKQQAAGMMTKREIARCFWGLWRMSKQLSRRDWEEREFGKNRSHLWKRWGRNRSSACKVSALEGLENLAVSTTGSSRTTLLLQRTILQTNAYTLCVFLQIKI